MPETLDLTPTVALDLLADRVRTLAASRTGRLAVGIAGGPGVGKSTLAAELVNRLNADEPGLAALVPMDGFHMRHAKLETLGLVRDKGAPHTFEGAAFVAFVAALKAAEVPMGVPGYSRKIEDVVDDAMTVGGDMRLLIIEGNYLLLPDAPWTGVKPLLDFAVYMEVPRDMVRARLLKRHGEEGLFTEERNREHVERVDLVNFDKVALSRPQADLVIDLITDH
jgi:pantothenate kinase